METRKTDLTSRLLASFHDLLASGALAPGAKLPPERELARQFGVSRPSLRHALKVLEAMGVIRQRVGSGTYLCEDAAGILRQPLEFVLLLDRISATEIIETRLILEPEVAAQAAENATAEHLRRLKETLDRRLDSLEATLSADLAFHHVIFIASANRLCVRLFSAMHEALASAMRITSRQVNWSHTLSYHRRIYEAIYARDAERAREAMRAHLIDARRILAELEQPHRAIEPVFVLPPAENSEQEESRQ